MLCLKVPPMDIIHREVGVVGDTMEESTKTRFLSECLSSSEVVTAAACLDSEGKNGGSFMDRSVTCEAHESDRNGGPVYQQPSNGAFATDVSCKSGSYSLGNEFSKRLWNSEPHFQFGSANGNKNESYEICVDGAKSKGRCKKKSAEGSPKVQRAVTKRIRKSTGAAEEPAGSPSFEDSNEKSENFCHANVLVFQDGGEFREKDALVEMKPYQGSQKMLTVSLNGKLYYTVKPESPGAFVGASRYSSYMTWKGEKGWKLEFDDRREWSLFCHMHEICFQRNGKTLNARQIPIPGVSEVECCLPNRARETFDRLPNSYIRTPDSEIQLVLASKRVIYDLDSEDEDWLQKNSTVSEQVLEALIERLEKQSFAKHDALSLDSALESCSELASNAAIQSVHSYWLQKRAKLGMPLSRYFQPLPWERYQTETQAWESMLQHKLQETSGKTRQQLEEIYKRPAYSAFCMRPRAFSQEKFLRQKSNNNRKISLNSISSPAAFPNTCNEPGPSTMAKPTVKLQLSKTKSEVEEAVRDFFKYSNKKKCVDVNSLAQSSPMLNINPSSLFTLQVKHTPMNSKTSVTSVLSLPSPSPSPSPLAPPASYLSTPHSTPTPSYPPLTPVSSRLANDETDGFHSLCTKPLISTPAVESKESVITTYEKKLTNGLSNSDFHPSTPRNGLQVSTTKNSDPACAPSKNTKNSHVNPSLGIRINGSYASSCPISREIGSKEEIKANSFPMVKTHSNVHTTGTENGRISQVEFVIKKEPSKEKKKGKKMGKKARRDRVQAAVEASRLKRLLKKQEMMQSTNLNFISENNISQLPSLNCDKPVSENPTEALTKADSSSFCMNKSCADTNLSVQNPASDHQRPIIVPVIGENYVSGDLSFRTGVETTPNGKLDKVATPAHGMNDGRASSAMKEKNVLSTYHRKHKRGSSNNSKDNLKGHDTVSEFSLVQVRNELRGMCNPEILQTLEVMEKRSEWSRNAENGCEEKDIRGKEVWKETQASDPAHVKNLFANAFEAAKLAENRLFEAKIAKNHAVSAISLAKALSMQLDMCLHDDTAQEQNEYHDPNGIPDNNSEPTEKYDPSISVSDTVMIAETQPSLKRKHASLDGYPVPPKPKPRGRKRKAKHLLVKPRKTKPRLATDEKEKEKSNNNNNNLLLTRDSTLKTDNERPNSEHMETHNTEKFNGEDHNSLAVN